MNIETNLSPLLSLALCWSGDHYSNPNNSYCYPTIASLFTMSKAQSKSKSKLGESSARVYESLYGPKSKPAAYSPLSASGQYEQVVQKVENLRQRELTSSLHRSLPDQHGQTAEKEPSQSAEVDVRKQPLDEQNLQDSSVGNGTDSQRNGEQVESICCSETVTRKNSKDIAKELISKDDIMCYFSEIIEECAVDVIDEKLSEEDPNELTSLELSKAHERSEHRFAHLCDLPLKIVLTPLSRGGRIVSRFAQLLEMQFGPLHAALQVGNVVLEWNDSSLVMPHLCNFEDQLLQSDVQGFSQWAEFTSQQYDKVRAAVTASDYRKQIELVYHVTAEKHRQIQALVDVIIKYNTTYYYNLFDRNCQHFVSDALKALGVEKPIQFTGGLREYFKALKDGRSPSVLAKFADHAQLDKYVKEKEDNGEMKEMTQNDLEFLLAQCFRFHLEQKSQLQDQNADLSNWVCKESTCCMERLECLIHHETLRIHNFKTIT